MSLACISESMARHVSETGGKDQTLPQKDGESDVRTRSRSRRTEAATAHLRWTMFAVISLALSDTR